MLKRIVFVFVGTITGLIAVLLLLAAIQPDSFRVERSASIKAPPEKIHALIADFHRWGAWSPWEKLDPDMKRTFSGATSGKGAAYAWEGNSDVGAGRMEIVESAPPSHVAIDLHFLKPFETRNTTIFNLQPEGDATTVTWAMQGPSPYMVKLMGLFTDMDAMIGKDFEKGLANLKAVAET